MQTWTKWAIALTAVVAAGGLMFAVPALAEETSPNPPAWVGGGMMAMHNAMAPLMSQMPAMHDQVTAAVAELLGMTVDELNGALAEGSTVADLAAEKGVASEEIQAVMTGQMRAFLDQAVADGTLTQEQADRLLQHHAQQSGSCHSGEAGGMMGGAADGMMSGVTRMMFNPGIGY